jgi:hypothetical protein
LSSNGNLSGRETIMKGLRLSRFFGLAAIAVLVVATAGVGAPAQAAHVAEAPPSDDSLTLDTQLPGSFGESGRPTPFVAVVANPGAVRADIHYLFRFRPFHGVTAEHFDIEFRDPGTGVWQKLELRDEADGSGVSGNTAPFTLAAASVTALNLRFAYHPGPFDAALLDVREITFDSLLANNGADVLATDSDISQILRMAIYFTGTPARLRAGTGDTFAVRYTNASENLYQPVRPFLFIEPHATDLDTGNVKVEWQNPRTKAWSPLPLVATGAGMSAQFTDAQAIEVRPRSTVTVKLRLSVAKNVTGGRILLRTTGFVDADRGFGLGFNTTWLNITR